MVIATLLPAGILPMQRCYPNAYLSSAYQFLFEAAEEVDKVYLFHLSEDGGLDLGFQPRPDNLFLVGAAEMSESLGAQPVDVWHDFGFHAPSVLSAIRAGTGKQFCISYEVPPERLLGSGSCGPMTLGRGDAAIYASEAFLELGNADCTGDRVGGAAQCNGWRRCIIPPALNIGRIEPFAKGDARCLLGYGESDIILLCYTDLNSASRAELVPLIDAFRTIAGTRKNMRFIVSGPGTHAVTAEFRHLTADSSGKGNVVFLLNPVSQVVPLLFAAADLFIQASDGLSRDSLITTVYAMAHRLPVIVPDYSFAGAIIEDGTSGVLVGNYASNGALEQYQWLMRCAPLVLIRSVAANARGMHTDSIVRVLSSLIDNPERRHSLGMAAYRRAADIYDLQHSVKAHIALWQALLNERCWAGPVTVACAHRMLPQSIFPARAPTLRGDLNVRTTERGITVLKQRVVAIPWAWKECIYSSVVIQLLEAAQESSTIDAITESVFATSGCVSSSLLRSGVLYQIGWCLNEGLLTPDTTNVPMFTGARL